MAGVLWAFRLCPPMQLAQLIQQWKSASGYRCLEVFVVSNGRCERIRTFDPLHPMQVLVNPRKLNKSLKVS